MHQTHDVVAAEGAAAEGAAAVHVVDCDAGDDGGGRSGHELGNGFGFGFGSPLETVYSRSVGYGNDSHEMETRPFVVSSVVYLPSLLAV